MNLFDFSTLAVACIPVVLGLVQVAKQVGLASRFYALVSIAFGIGVVFLTGAAWQLAIAQGIVVGLAASGLWSGVQTTIQSKPDVTPTVATPSQPLG